MSTPIGGFSLAARMCGKQIDSSMQFRQCFRDIARASHRLDIVTAMLFHDMSAGTPRRCG
jgi:hypothetical protein